VAVEGAGGDPAGDGADRRKSNPKAVYEFSVELTPYSRDR
jgi:hypothetical protein